MTLLCYELTPASALIMTDTLATTPDGSPRSFTSKCMPVPHLGLAMVVTGVADLGARWLSMLGMNVVCRDIEMLDLHTPLQLARLWDELRAEHGGFQETATIYHFGCPDGSDEYMGYAYRSKSDFCSERLQHGFGLKPAPLNGLDQPPGTVDEWIDLASQIKAEQETVDEAERLYIGGALILTALTDGAIMSKEIHRFPDIDDAWQTMNVALQ